MAGVEYLQRFGGVHPTVLSVTRQHHERLDGSGYPDGLRGDQIDMASRICAFLCISGIIAVTTVSCLST